MNDLYQVNLIISIVSLLLIITNIISSVIIILNNKKFAKSEIVIKLYTSSLYSYIFAVLSAGIIYALWHFYRIQIFTIALCIALIFGAVHIFIMQYSACGITKQALFINGRTYQWHNIYDFYLDKNRRLVIFSSNVKGGLTLKGVTKPLKYNRDDEEKLEKYLEEHKSKRFNKIIIR